MRFKRYFYIQKMIEKRKKEISDSLRKKYWDEDYDFGTEIARDTDITDLYIQLENCLEPRGYKKQWFQHNGIWKTLVELAEESAVSYDILRSRVLYLNWDLEEAMKTPKIRRNELSTQVTTFLQEFFKGSTIKV